MAFLFSGRILGYRCFGVASHSNGSQEIEFTFYEFQFSFHFQFFISFAVGSGLLMREIDDGTWHFSMDCR